MSSIRVKFSAGAQTKGWGNPKTQTQKHGISWGGGGVWRMNPPVRFEPGDRCIALHCIAICIRRISRAFKSSGLCSRVWGFFPSEGCDEHTVSGFSFCRYGTLATLTTRISKNGRMCNPAKQFGR